MRYVASYHERRQTARLALRANDEITLPDAVLADFALWPFGGEGRSDDRLAMLQRTLAQALPGTADENTVALLAALPILLAETKAQYEVFIDDQLDEYAKQRQGVADYAAEVAKKIADSVEAVTKGLVDTSLATIAAVAAVVLAAVTNDKLRGTAFSAILWIYAAYVYVQALYRLLSATHSAILLRDEAQARLQGAAEQLGERTVQPLWDALSRRWAQIQAWSIVTAIAYVVIVSLIVLLGLLGPQTGALRATAQAPTPTPQQPIATITTTPMVVPPIPGTP